jgi:hypothetical protein
MGVRLWVAVCLLVGVSVGVVVGVFDPESGGLFLGVLLSVLLGERVLMWVAVLLLLVLLSTSMTDGFSLGLAKI